MNSESRYRKTKKKNTERRKPNFIYELVQYSDLYKPAINKIMTTGNNA